MKTTDETPTFDQLVRERKACGDWVIDELRPPFDLNDLIGKSYETIMRRKQADKTKRRIVNRRKGNRPARKGDLP